MIHSDLINNGSCFRRRRSYKASRVLILSLKTEFFFYLNNGTTKKTSHWKKFQYYNAPKFWKLYTQQLDRFLNNNFICKCMLLISPYTWSLKQTHVNKIKIYIIRFSSTFLEKQFTVSEGRSEFYKKAVVFTASASGATSLRLNILKGKSVFLLSLTRLTWSHPGNR